MSYSPFYILLDGEPITGSSSESKETTSSTAVSSDSGLIEQVERTNDLLSGIIFFLGILLGAIFCLVFWQRFKSD